MKFRTEMWLISASMCNQYRERTESVRLCPSCLRSIGQDLTGEREHDER